VKRVGNLNFYEILDVRPDASHVEIQRAYERARKTYSFDSIAVYSLLDEDEIEAMARLVEEAYRTIGDEGRRREYDRMLGCPNEGKGQTVASSPHEDMGQSDTLLRPGKVEILSPEERGKIDGMISQSGFVFTGPALREIREALGLERADISEQTKVSRTYLHFIEEENFAHLPALVYLKGFVTEYAKLLGLDIPRVLEDYVNRYRMWEKSRAT
jgi:curved DNA-binding protein CbpA